MRAGNLRDRVGFVRLQGSGGRFGNEAQSWGDPFLTVWADVLESTGKEVVAAGRLEAPRTATVRVRDTPDARTVKEADGAVIRGAQWNIRSIARIGRKGEILEMLCEAQVAT
jgi:SPP1 family predicted phage head-tail adaptor